MAILGVGTYLYWPRPSPPPVVKEEEPKGQEGPEPPPPTPSDTEEWEKLTRAQRDLDLKQSEFVKRVGKQLPQNFGTELTPEQRSLLAARLAEERGSLKSLLEEILRNSDELSRLRQEIGQLSARLPEHFTVAAGDKSTHLDRAIAFLKGKGLSDEQARTEATKVGLQTALLPGFNVWMYYRNGTFGTWVTQGTAATSPQEYQAYLARATDDLLNATRGEARRVDRDRKDLQTLLRLLETEREKLSRENAILKTDLKMVGEEIEKYRAEANTIQYVVDCKNRLVSDRIIDRDYGLTNPRRGRSVNLIETKEIAFEVTCVRAIRTVVLTPGQFAADRDFKLATEGPVGRLTILNPEPFKMAGFVAIVLE